MRRSDFGVRLRERIRLVPPLPSVAAYKPTRHRTLPDFHPTPSAPPGRSARRRSREYGRPAGSAIACRSSSTPTPRSLKLTFRNRGKLGVHFQARSLTVAGAPFSYTIGAGDELVVSLPNPGTYDLSLHGPNGFFRHFAGSAATALQRRGRRRPRARQAEARADRRGGPRRPAPRRSSSRSPTHTAATGRSGCTATRRSSSTPALRRLVRHRADDTE